MHCPQFSSLSQFCGVMCEHKCECPNGQCDPSRNYACICDDGSTLSNSQDSCPEITLPSAQSVPPLIALCVDDTCGRRGRCNSYGTACECDAEFNNRKSKIPHIYEDGIVDTENPLPVSCSNTSEIQTLINSMEHIVEFGEANSRKYVQTMASYKNEKADAHPHILEWAGSRGGRTVDARFVQTVSSLNQAMLLCANNKNECVGISAEEESANSLYARCLAIVNPSSWCYGTELEKLPSEIQYSSFFDACSDIWKQKKRDICLQLRHKLCSDDLCAESAKDEERFEAELRNHTTKSTLPKLPEKILLQQFKTNNAGEYVKLENGSNILEVDFSALEPVLLEILNFMNWNLKFSLIKEFDNSIQEKKPTYQFPDAFACQDTAQVYNLHDLSLYPCTACVDNCTCTRKNAIEKAETCSNYCSDAEQTQRTRKVYANFTCDCFTKNNAFPQFHKTVTAN